MLDKLVWLKTSLAARPRSHLSKDFLGSGIPFVDNLFTTSRNIQSVVVKSS
jgi:hypothetical protein